MEGSAKYALDQSGLHPRKQLGQHFLTNPQILGKLVRAAEVSPQDTIVEIGPGLGHLTRLLAAEAGRVIAVELDPDLAARLRLLQAEQGLANLEVVQGDILQLDLGGMVQAKTGAAAYKVVANLPYYITSAVLRHVLTAAPKPARVVVTVQREVAQRMAARPPGMSLLAVSVQFFADVKIGGIIPAGAFFPPPKVDSAWVVLQVHPQPRSPVPDEEAFFQVVKAGFETPRKQIKNTLAHGLGLAGPQAQFLLEQAGVEPTRRAETLTLHEWVRLAAARRQARF